MTSLAILTPFFLYFLYIYLKDRSLVSLSFVYAAPFFILNILFFSLSFSVYDLDFSLDHFIIILIYFLSFVLFSFGLRCGAYKSATLKLYNIRKNSKISFLILITYLLVFYWIYLYSDFLPNFRLTYELSRHDGNAFIWFVTFVMINLSVVSSIFFYNGIGRIIHLTFLSLGYIVIGTKFGVIFLGISVLTYSVLFFGFKLTFSRNFFLILFICITPFLLFYYFHVPSFEMILPYLIGYTDYTFNASSLLSIDPYWGQINFENNLYSRIPRFIFPSKPFFFGDYRLVNDLSLTHNNTGFPSFGYWGSLIADFGYFSIFIISFISFFKGFFISYLLKGSLILHSFVKYVLVLILLGYPLVSLGSTHLIVETILLSFLLAYKFKLKSI